MRAVVTGLALLGLAACASPEIPDSGAEAGFASPYAPAQPAGPLANPLPSATAISSETLSDPAEPIVLPPLPSQTQAQTQTQVQAAPTRTASAASQAPVSGSADGADLAADTAAALAASTANSGVAPVQAAPTNPAPQILNNPGISDENDFTAVSQRQTIESDAARIQRNRAQYQQVAPTALPKSNVAAGPNIVEYALQTNHARGDRLYTRSGFNLGAKAQRNCAKYASSDRAQIDFLSKGGPRRDRLGLDPDGDGYACGWDPAPYRAAVKN